MQHYEQVDAIFVRNASSLRRTSSMASLLIQASPDNSPAALVPSSKLQNYKPLTRTAHSQTNTTLSKRQNECRIVMHIVVASPNRIVWIGRSWALKSTKSPSRGPSSLPISSRSVVTPGFIVIIIFVAPLNNRKGRRGVKKKLPIKPPPSQNCGTPSKIVCVVCLVCVCCVSRERVLVCYHILVKILDL